MSFECRVEADSISPEGIRLTTFVVTYPRIIHAELLTHRSLSRNSASSRAIPVEKMIAMVDADPYIPSSWGSNQKGMQAGADLSLDDAERCSKVWRQACDDAIFHASVLAKSNVHKQLANRLLEPFSWITVVITATDWANFFALRCHPDAHPEFQRIAGMMRDAMAASTPHVVYPFDWHLPFIRKGDLGDSVEALKRISAGRCARVSYLTHDGKRDPHADIALAERLVAATPRHASPLEHVATPCPGRHANFRGWRQYRLETPNHTVEESQ